MQVMNSLGIMPRDGLKSVDELSLSGFSKDQVCYCCAITAVIIGLVVINIGTGLEHSTGISQAVVSGCCKLVIFGCFLMCLPFIVKSKRVHWVALYIAGIVFVSMLQTVLFPLLNDYYLETVLSYISTILPICIILLMLESYSLLIFLLYKTSIALAIIIAIIILLFGGNFFPGYNMGFSTALVIPVNVLILYLLFYQTDRTSKLSSLVAVAILCLAIVLYGSRGALGAILAFSIVLFVKWGIKGRYSAVGLIIGILAILLFVLLFDEVVGFASELSVRLGFQSRTLELLSQNEIVSHDSGRTSLWLTILEQVAEAPFDIRGINADYAIIGSYSHNFVIELWSSFGFILGSLMTALIIVFAVKTIAGTNTSENHVRLLFMSSFLPIALWSQSIWLCMGFWAWMTLAIKPSASWSAG